MLYATLFSAAIASPLEASLVEYAQAVCGAQKVEVDWVGVGVEPPATARLVWEGEPCRRNPSLKVTFLVDGVPESTISARPRLAVYVEVPVASQSVMAGEVVQTSPGLVRVERVIGEPVAGERIARMALQAGDAVTHSNSRPVPDAARGQNVTLVAESGALRIEAPGQLLADAHIGEDVRVMNQATRTTVTGTLVEPGLVRVQ